MNDTTAFVLEAAAPSLLPPVDVVNRIAQSSDALLAYVDRLSE